MDSKIKAALDTSSLTEAELDSERSLILMEQATLEALNHKNSEYHVVKLCCLDLAVGNCTLEEIQNRIYKNPERYLVAKCYMNVNDVLAEKPDAASDFEHVFNVLVDLLRSWHNYIEQKNAALKDLLEILKKPLGN